MLNATKINISREKLDEDLQVKVARLVERYRARDQAFAFPFHPITTRGKATY